MTDDEAVNKLKACKIIIEKLKNDPKYPFTQEIKSIYQGYQDVFNYYKNDAHFNRLLEEAGVTHRDILETMRNYILRDVPKR